MSEAGTLRVLIADDHSPMRLGLAAIISMVPGAQCVGQAVDGEDAVEQYLALRPDLMTLDLRMPGLDGLEVIQRVVAAAPEAKILVVTMHDRQDDIVRCLRAGARGYVLKSAPAREIEDAIVTVARGLRYTPPYVADQLAAHLLAEELSARELEVLGLVRLGLSNKQIGNKLGLTEGTVKSHVRTIMGKLGAATRSQAVNLATERGMLR